MSSMFGISEEALRVWMQEEYDGMEGLFVHGDMRLTFAHAAVAVKAQKELTKLLHNASKEVELGEEEDKSCSHYDCSCDRGN